METFKEIILESIKSLSTQPTLIFMLVIFIIMAYMQVVQLEKINETLVQIRETNIGLINRFEQENNETIKFQKIETEVLEVVQRIEYKISK